MVSDLFNGNIFVLFLIFAISVFSIDKLTERQKITFIYVCTYGMVIIGSVSEKIILIVMVVTLFLIQEFFTPDKKKVKLLYKIHYKIADFLYMGNFKYKIWLVIIAICFRTSYVKTLLGWNEIVINIVSALIFLSAFIWIFSLSEEFNSFTEMYDFLYQKPYHNVRFDNQLQKRLNIITHFEDHLYWNRKKSYSFFSIEFLKVWIKSKREIKKEKCRMNFSFRENLKRLKAWPSKTWAKLKRIIKWVRINLTRGHSTIPMQLIRILGYKHGLVFGNTKTSFKYYKMIKRKIFEIIYSRIFFEGLRHYLITELCNELNDYRKYLVYIYPYTVQTKIEGKTYAPASKAFAIKGDEDNIPVMNQWNLKRVIDMGFGFNGLGLTAKRVEENEEFLKQHNYKCKWN